MNDYGESQTVAEIWANDLVKFQGALADIDLYGKKLAGKFGSAGACTRIQIALATLRPIYEEVEKASKITEEEWEAAWHRLHARKGTASQL